jgi:hypothetical protein
MTQLRLNWIEQSKPARRRMIVALWSSLALITALVLAGCSGEPPAESLPTETLNPVKGIVLTAEGKPLTEGTITFVPVKSKSRAASGKIGTDGSFTLKSGDSGEGVAEGEFKVRVESTLTVPSTDPKKPKRVVPLAYEDEDTSLLVITIKSGPNDLPPIKLLPVDPKKAAARAKRGRDD